MKRLEWAWTLPHGETVEATIALPQKSETVSLDGKVVSQTDVPKADGHIVPLAGEGAYRSAREVKVVFDSVGDSVANAVLTIDGSIVSPKRSPRPRRSLARVFIAAGLVLAIGAVILMRVHSSPKPIVDHGGPGAMVLASIDNTSTDLPTGAASVISSLDPSFQACWDKAPITDKTGGYVTIKLEIGESGAVSSTFMGVNGPGPAVSSCALDAAKAAQFAPMAQPSTLRFRIAFIVARTSAW